MTGRLSIAKLHAPCFVTGSPDAAQAVADRAVRALRDHFPQTARHAFTRWLDRADESIWIVRKIELAVLVAAESAADSVAASTVTALGRALGEALVGDGDGLNTIRFENRAACVASFVTDAAWGDAWSRWYYAPFQGLKLLPASSAIRTALTEDPTIGRHALERLDASALARVASILTSQDEALVLTSLASTGGDDVAELAFSRAWSECKRQLEVASSPASLLVTFVRAPADIASTAFLRALRQVHGAFEALRHLRPAQLARALPLSLPDAALEGLGTRTDIPPEILREMVGHLTLARSVPAQAEAATTAATPFGGLLLLLRELGDLPPMMRGPPIALKWLTLAMCAGRERSEAVLHDEALRNLLGISSLPLADIAKCLRVTPPVDLEHDEPTSRDRRWLSFDRRIGISPAWSASLALAAHRALRSFSRRLPGFAEASAQYLWENFLASDASLEYEANRVIVRYGRPPLHLMLTLTGLTRGLEAGHDEQDRPIIVFGRD